MVGGGGSGREGKEVVGRGRKEQWSWNFLHCYLYSAPSPTIGRR